METLITTPDVQETQESEDQKLNFLGRMRQKVAHELGLTFTLPDPRDGVMDTVKNAGLKAVGMAGVYAGNMIFQAGEHGVLRTPGETEQAYDHIRHAVEGVGVSTVALGAISIWLANRMREGKY